MSSGNDSEDELRCAGCSKRYIKKAELNFHAMHCEDYTHYMQSFEKTSTRIGRSAAQIAKSFQDRRKRKAAEEPESSSDSTSSSESDRDSGPSTRLQASDHPSSTNDDYADDSQHLYEEADISMQAASEPDDTTVDLVQERSASEPAGTSSVPPSPNLSDNASESNISDDGINRPAPWRNVAPQSPLGDELPCPWQRQHLAHLRPWHYGGVGCAHHRVEIDDEEQLSAFDVVDGCDSIVEDVFF